MSKCFGDFYEPKKKRVIDEYEQEHLRKARENWSANFVSPEQYVKFKLRMLRKDMYIEPTKEEITHLYTLKTETAIDNAVHSIIARHWSEF